jgi:hypothetical protein
LAPADHEPGWSVGHPCVRSDSNLILNAIEINKPTARSFTPEEQAAMDKFRDHVHQLALHGGLSADNIRNVLQAMKAHPDFSTEILQVLTAEARALHDVAPGARLIDLE